MVDDTRPLQQLALLVGNQMGIRNAEEFSMQYKAPSSAHDAYEVCTLLETSQCDWFPTPTTIRSICSSCLVASSVQVAVWTSGSRRTASAVQEKVFLQRGVAVVGRRSGLCESGVLSRCVWVGGWCWKGSCEDRCADTTFVGVFNWFFFVAHDSLVSGGIVCGYEQGIQLIATQFQVTHSPTSFFNFFELDKLWWS